MATKRKARFEAMKAKKAQVKDDTFKRPTPEERFALENARLDEQIAFKNKMRSILTDAQYQKWNAMREDHKKGMKNHFKKDKVSCNTEGSRSKKSGRPHRQK